MHQPSNSHQQTAPTHLRPFRWMGLCGTALAAACSVNAMSKPALAQQAPLNPTLDVGVIQRFGSTAPDEIVLKPEPGDRLTLKLKQGNQEQVIATTDEVKLDVVMQPLPQPAVNEQVVLSTHRSFESAEDSANQWRAKGIEVEIAQPRQWQVWAKRGTYSTPLLRRLLMQNLQSNGAKTAFINTQRLQQVPKAVVSVNGGQYQQDQVQIEAGTEQVEVSYSRDDHGDRLYAGSLTLQPNAYGTYTLVNHVPLETYLRGVVPHEIGSGAPPTAVEAQAILARTYALRNLRRFAIDNYQICADTQCQVYWGLTGTDPDADRAIASTRGQVLVYNNELVDALYSSTTGGVTAAFTDVWNGVDRPYLRAVVDSVQNAWDLTRQSLADENNFRAFMSRKAGFNEDGWDMFRWRVENTLPQIAADLKRYLVSKQHPLANFSRIEAMRVAARSASGRVQKLEIMTDRGIVELEKDEILRALYAPNSILFYLEPIYETVPKPQANPTTNLPPASPPAEASAEADPNIPVGIKTAAAPKANPVLKGYAFVGGGLGHGVGMSQTGAYHLGKIGWSSQQILGFYYPGTQLQPLSSAITFWREPATPAVAPTTNRPAAPSAQPEAPASPAAAASP